MTAVAGDGRVGHQQGFEPGSDPKDRKAPWRELFVLVHEGKRQQLAEITSLIDSGVIHPVVDRAFPFESTKEALAYADKGRATGKVVVKMR